MKRRILLIILVVLAIGGWYAYSEYNRREKDLKDVKADFNMDASALIAAFEKDTASANKQYVDKVIAVTGSVTKIDADGNPVVIILGNPAQMSSVKCSMDSSHADDYRLIKEGNLVTLKGRCTGGETSELGLGTDVSLKRSVVETKK